MKLKVMPDKVLLLLPDIDLIQRVGNESAGGVRLYTVSYAKPTKDVGEVIAVGDKVKVAEIKKGVKVHFDNQQGRDLKIDGRDFVLINPEHITGIFCEGED